MEKRIYDTPRAFKKFGFLPAESAETLLFPFAPKGVGPNQAVATVLGEFPKAVIRGVCENGGTSYLLIDASNVRVEDSSRTSPAGKTDLRRKIAEARIQLRLSRVKIDGMKADLARSQATLKTIREGNPEDATWIGRVAWGALHATLVFGVLTEGVKDVATWGFTLRGIDRTQSYRIQKYVQMVKLMRENNLCGPVVSPGFTSYLGDLLLRESFYNGVGLAMVLGIVWGEKALTSGKTGEIPQELLDDPEFARAAPGINPEDEKKYLEKLKGMDVDELEKEYARLVEELELIDVGAAPIEEELKRTNLEVLAAGHEKLKNVDLSKLGDEQVRILVARLQEDENPKTLLQKLGAGDLAELVGIGLGFGPGTEWARQRLELIPAHRAMEGRRQRIGEMARGDARTELRRLAEDGVVRRCGGDKPGMSDGQRARAEAWAAGLSAELDPEATAAPAEVAPVSAPVPDGERAPAAEGPENATRSFVERRSPLPRGERVRERLAETRIRDFQFQEGWSYPLGEALPKLPVQVRTSIEAFLKLNNVVRDLASIRVGYRLLVTPDGQTFPNFFLFRANGAESAGPDARVGSGAAAVARTPGGPAQGPKISGPVLLLNMGLNLGAMLVIDWSLTKAGIENPALRIPAQWSAAYGITYGLHRMGLAARPTLKGFFVRGAFFAAGQIATAVVLDRLAQKVDIDLFRLGTFSNAAGSIASAYALLEFGERYVLPRVGPQLARLAATLGVDGVKRAAVGRVARGGAWATVGLIGLNYGIKGLFVDDDYEGAVNKRVTDAVYKEGNVYGLDGWDFLGLPLAIKGLRAGSRFLVPDGMEWAVADGNPKEVAKVRREDAELSDELAKVIRFSVTSLVLESGAEMGSYEEVLAMLERPVTLTAEEQAIADAITRKDFAALAGRDESLVKSASLKMRLTTIQGYAQTLTWIKLPVSDWARDLFNRDGTLKPGRATALVDRIDPNLRKEQRTALAMFAAK